MGSYQVVYDATDSIMSGHLAITEGFVVIVSLALMGLYALGIQRIAMRGQSLPPLTVAFPYVILGAALLFAIGFGVHYYMAVERVKNAMTHDGLTIVCGRAQYRPWVPHVSPAVLVVGNTRFVFWGYATDVGGLDAQQPIELYNGDEVRVSSLNGLIVKIEVRR